MTGGRFARSSGRSVIEVAVLGALVLFGMGMSAGPARAAWSAPQLASPALHAAAVSCASRTFCMAVGDKVAVWDGSSWSIQPSDHSPNRLDLVACPAVGTCYGAFERRFWRYQAGHWTRLGAPVTISNLSCPRAHFCMITTGGIHETQGAVYTFDGTTWSGPMVPSPGQFLWGVSCTSRTFCAVVDGLDRVFDFDGHSWGSGTPVSFYYGSGPTAISCSRPGYCAVVNNYGEITFETAGTWGPELDVNPGVPFWAVSCAGVRFCAAASGITDFYFGISAGGGVRLRRRTGRQRRGDHQSGVRGLLRVEPLLHGAGRRLRRGDRGQSGFDLPRVVIGAAVSGVSPPIAPPGQSSSGGAADRLRDR